ncbi:MAG: hypothetical protein KGL20_05230 [Rhodospirillales bacterium]|nr:hypothetical protein [Rhodospirillales bacterium]
MTYFRDLWTILKADGIALDETEAALLGAPNGETISLWAAMEARHGIWLAYVACAIFSVLIQRDHCHKQLLGQPMKPANYVRTIACLLVPIVAILAILAILWRWA